MQKIHKQIFELAKEELPHKLITNFSIDSKRISPEQSVHYKGFKISKIEDIYKWKDTRHSDYYEDVDPLITENILKQGFKKTLIQVMLHDDVNKIAVIDREVHKINQQNDYWLKESQTNYNSYIKTKAETISNSEDMLTEDLEDILESINNKYERRKHLYNKKRRILKEEKDNLLADRVFFEARIKLNNNIN